MFGVLRSLGLNILSLIRLVMKVCGKRGPPDNIAKPSSKKIAPLKVVGLKEEEKEVDQTTPKREINLSEYRRNICSGEDLKVLLVEKEGHYGMLALDGHKGLTENYDLPQSGKGCRDKIDANRTMLGEMLLAEGAPAVVDKCQELCKDEPSGAMVIACDLYEETLRIASLGDCFLWVYVRGGDGRFHLFYQHDMHGEEYYLEHTEMALELGIKPRRYQARQPCPLPDGTFQYSLKKDHICYFDYANGEWFAGCAGLGHCNMKCFPKIVRTVHLPPGKDFYIATGSDGVSDVIHPESNYWHKCPTNAEAICQKAYCRWGRTGKTFQVVPKEKEDGQICQSWSFAPLSDKQADDISVGLLKGTYTHE